MPRITRKSLETSFFHIIVQGVNKEYIFNSKQYIEYYISLINQYKGKYDIEILAYCIMNNHAHLLMFTEKTDEMSKFMHQINFIFAQQYNKAENRIGHVFRDRYLCEGIYSEKYLINCINYIHMNPVKANIVKSCGKYKYSTYNDYKYKKGVWNNKILKDIIGDSNYEEFLKSNDDECFLDVDVTHEEIIKRVIKRYSFEKQKETKEIICEEKLAKELVEILKKQYRMPYVDIKKELKISTRKLEKLRF